MNLPTVTPTAKITLFGEEHALRFTFRAFKEMGVNPFDPESVKAWEAEPRTLEDLAAQIRAGLLHEYYGRSAARAGEEPPTIDDLMNEIDAFTYVHLCIALQGVKGETQTPDTTEKPGESNENPPAA